MARRSRRVDPDFVLDADRGLSDQPTVKQAEFIPADAADAREQRRRGLRAVDEARDALTDLTRPRRDRDRATPRDVAGEVPDSRMTRSLPEPSQMRTPLSARQRNARSATKWAVQDRLTATQHAAVAHVLGEPQNWRDVNDELSAAAGNVQQLEERKRLQVQRVDRAIQAYERENHRGHVVYSNVRMPRAVAALSSTRYWSGNSNRAASLPSTASPPPRTPCTRWRSLVQTRNAQWCVRSKRPAECIWAARTRSMTPHTCCPAACACGWSVATQPPTVDQMGLPINDRSSN